MIRSAQWAGIVSAALWGACAGAPGVDTAPAQATRCFGVHIGEWRPPSEPSPRQEAPEIFELLEETGTERFERGKKIVRPVIGHLGFPSAYWELRQPDSMLVTWTNGFEGVQFRLAGEGERWAGMASTFSDVRVAGQPRPSAPMVLSPVPCP